MTDRLPAPLASADVAFGAERASATPANVRRLGRVETAAEARVSGARPATFDAMEAWLVRAITGTDADAADAAFVVTDGPRLSARARLDVYRFGYRTRLVECLADDYPVLASTLGEEPFEALCHGYVERFPSGSPSLNYFGRHLARHCLETAVPGFVGQSRFLSELASLEWAIVEVIHGEAAPPLDATALAKLGPADWATARFERGDAVRLLLFEYPVNAYFQARRVGGTEPRIPEPAPSATVVYRHGLTVWRMDLTPAMTRVLAALLGGAPIGEALGKMGVDETDRAAVAEAERSVMVWFREWVSGGLFSRLITGGS